MHSIIWKKKKLENTLSTVEWIYKFNDSTNQFSSYNKSLSRIKLEGKKLKFVGSNNSSFLFYVRLKIIKIVVKNLVKNMSLNKKRSRWKLNLNSTIKSQLMK